MKTNTMFGFLAVSLMTAGSASLTAQQTDQSTAADQNQSALQDQTVELSPFLVQSENAAGYETEQSLGGTRFSANILDLSTSITVMNSQMISDLNAQDVQHLIGLGVAGVTQNQWGFDDVMIRGFRADYSMRDGVTQDSYSPTPMYDIERVEVIKGPQAMVMGDNTFIGGAFNFVFRPATATPHTEIIFTDTTSEAGNSYYRLQANTAGPLIHNKDFTLLYRITVGGTAGNSDHPEDLHKQKFVGGEFMMYFHGNKDTSLTFDWHYYDNEDQYYYDDFLLPTDASGVPKLSPYDVRTFAETTRGANIQPTSEWLFHGKFLSRLSEHDNLRIFLSYVDYYLLEAQAYGDSFQADGFHLNRDFVNYYEKDLEYTAQADVIDQRSWGEWISNSFSTGLDYRQLQQPAGEVFFSGQFPAIDVRLKNDPVLAGDDALAAQDNAVPYNTFYDTNEFLYTFSYYGQERVSFWQDRIFLSGGYRWYHARATNADYIAGTLSETDYAPFQAENLGIVVKPLKWFSLYYAHTTTQIPVAGYGIPLSGPPYPFQPSAGKDNEVGVKAQYRFNDRFSVYADYDHFYEELTNVRTGVPGEYNAQTGVPVILQSASNSGSGGEGDFGGRYSGDAFDFDFLLTAYRGDTHSAINGGHWATNSVGDTSSAMGKFTFHHSFLRGAYIGGGVSQAGPKWEQPYMLETPNLYKSFAGYSITKWWSLQFNWDNMTNRRYVQTVGSTASVLVALPGEISLETRFHW